MTILLTLGKDKLFLRWNPPVSPVEIIGSSDIRSESADVGRFQRSFSSASSSPGFRWSRKCQLVSSWVKCVPSPTFGHAWSLSGFSSCEIGAQAPLVATPHRKSRVAEEDDALQTFETVQQQSFVSCDQENGIQNLGLRWENVDRNIDERVPGFHRHGLEKGGRDIRSPLTTSTQLQNDASTQSLNKEDDSVNNEHSTRDVQRFNETFEGKGSLSESLEDLQDHNLSNLEGGEETSEESVYEGGYSRNSSENPYSEEAEVESFFLRSYGGMNKISSNGPQVDGTQDGSRQDNSLCKEVLRENESRYGENAATITTGRVDMGTSGGYSALNLGREMEVAVRAVQLACLLSQRTQQRILRKEEKADKKNDRSLVTVADWGVQAVVSWVLSQAFEGEDIPMIAEEDTRGLRGMEKIDLLQRVVSAVNECLHEAGILGMSPSALPLGAMDVLKAIGKGNAEGGRHGRYWVLDPVDGTLGFVRGDQYAIALALLQDGEVVLAVLGCPNFPLRKQWLRYHHRYYRLASKLFPPDQEEWHKGLILTTTKGAGQVMMQPLLVNADGLPRLHFERHAPQPVSVSPIDDPAKATFCEPFEKANSSHSFTAGLAQSLGLRNRPLRVYSLAKYAAIARGDAEIFMKFAKAGYKEKIWDHAAGVLIVQEAGGVVTDAAGQPLDFSQGRLLEGLDRGIIACSRKNLHEKLLKAVDASWNSSTL